MDASFIALLAVAFLAVAALYSTVGHAGASGYLAIMILLAVPVEMLRPVALTLNIVVAALATWRFWQAGLLDLARILPFAWASVPLAFIGGWIHLPDAIYRPLLGATLLLSALYLAWRSTIDPKTFDDFEPRVPPVKALLTGGAIGLLSGLTGIGGGVFLSPVVLLLRWLPIRRASGTAAAFILINSLAGFAGNLASARALPPAIAIWAAAVLIGGWIGTSLGIYRLKSQAIVWVLALALLIAGAKFLLPLWASLS